MVCFIAECIAKGALGFNSITPAPPPDPCERHPNSRCKRAHSFLRRARGQLKSSKSKKMTSAAGQECFGSCSDSSFRKAPPLRAIGSAKELLGSVLPQLEWLTIRKRKLDYQMFLQQLVMVSILLPIC